MAGSWKVGVLVQNLETVMVAGGYVNVWVRGDAKADANEEKGERMSVDG